MTIRKKTRVILALIVAVLASLLIVTARFIILKGYEDLEFEFAHRNLDHAKNVLFSSIEKIDAITGDYSAWDDTYSYANDTKNTSYEEDNFFASSFTNLGIQCMLFFNSSGDLVSQPFFQNSSSEIANAPPDLVLAIKSAKGLLCQPGSPNGAFGIMTIDAAIVMVASRPILKNNFIGPARGTLVFCRYVDSLEIRRLSGIIGHSMALTVADKVRKENDTAGVLDFVSSGSPSTISVINPHTLRSHLRIHDIAGQGSVVLSCTSDRDIYRYGLKIFYYGLIWFLVIIIIFSAFVLFTLEIGVLGRLNWLRKEIDAIEDHGTGAQSVRRIKTKGRDEVSTVAHDINDLLSAIEQTTQRAELSEKQYGILFTQMLSGFAVHEVVRDGNGAITDYRFLDVNPSFERLTGLKKKDVTGRTAREVLPGNEPQWIDRYARVVETGEPAHFEDFNAALGKHFEVMAFKTGDNRFGVAFSDITNRKNAEEERAKAQEELAQAHKMEAIGQLAGGIAHDFNNQMTSALGYAELMRDQTAANKNLTRFAEKIIMSIRRATDLTAQLLAFARKGKYRDEVVNMHSIIIEVVMLLEHSIGKNIRIIQQLDARPAATIGDPTQLQNAILNIGLNARDAMPEGGTLTFATGIESLDEEFCNSHKHEIKPGLFLRISIADTGTGIDQETRKHIFEPFFTTKPRGKGTGMGLAAAYGTVKHHKGAITVHSKPGKGSTFSIYLPATEEQVAPTESEEQIKTIPGNPRILIVDDEDNVAETVTDLLSAMGCFATRCRNGREAIEHYRTSWKQVDLVILDMIMPEMGGRATLPHLKEINPLVKVLVSSGYALDEDALRMLQEGAIDFLQKPFTRNSLGKAIIMALKA